ncbi:MAG: hypothetical protein R2848_09450 [Thermomicrobiales bacterium]
MADVFQPSGAKQGIGKRMQQDVGIRMPSQAEIRRDRNPAKHQGTPFGKRMNVVADPGSNHRASRLEECLHQVEIAR